VSGSLVLADNTVAHSFIEYGNYSVVGGVCLVIVTGANGGDRSF